MTIHYQVSDRIATITLDREKVLNALDLDHLEQLLEKVESAGKNPGVHCVVLEARGRAFCVGADIKAMDTMGEAEFSRAALLYQELCRACRACPAPIITGINGYALGGGLEIALMADLRIAGESAKLGLPDAELGFSPTGGLTWLLNRIVGSSRAMHLALTGEILEASRAMEIGLVTRVVADNDLGREISDLANWIAACPRTGVINIKKTLLFAQDNDLESTLELEARCDSECYADPETRARLRAFLDKRKQA